MIFEFAQHIFLSAQKSLEVLKRVSEKNFNADENSEIKVPNEKCIQTCVHQFKRSFDDKFGGFSTAPKFPQPSNFNFLFHVYSRNKESEEGRQALEMCLKSLERIAYGGIHDHVNCGKFSKYI